MNAENARLTKKNLRKRGTELGALGTGELFELTHDGASTILIWVSEKPPAMVTGCGHDMTAARNDLDQNMQGRMK